MKTTTSTDEIQKLSKKSARKKCQSHLNHKFFSKNVIYDQLNILSEQMGTVSVRILR